MPRTAICAKAYHDLYRQVVQIKREADALTASEADKQRRIALLTEEVEELDAAGLTAGEEESPGRAQKGHRPCAEHFGGDHRRLCRAVRR